MNQYNRTIYKAPIQNPVQGVQHSRKYTLSLTISRSRMVLRQKYQKKIEENNIFEGTAEPHFVISNTSVYISYTSEQYFQHFYVNVTFRKFNFF
jgi:hypothetical protein